jgi:hypothetical protein
MPPDEMPPNESTRAPVDRVLLAAGCLQLLAGFAPAARARVIGAVPFARLPTAGLTLAVLGVLTIAVAVWRRGWWRWAPGVLSGLVLGVVYWRLTHRPSATFVDPLLRRVVHPSWGFVPMAAAVLLSLVGAARSLPRPERHL